MTQPYFKVGDQAEVVHDVHPDRNGDVTIEGVHLGAGRLRDKRCSSGAVMITEGVSYSVDRDLTGNGLYWVKQSALRKKHKPSSQSFSELMKINQPA